MRRAIVADTQPIWMAAVENILIAEGIEVVGRSTPGRDALALLEEQHPDIFITEAAGDGMGITDYIREARACSAGSRIFVLTADPDTHAVHEALLGGADAYVMKTAAPDDLVAALRQTFEASVFILHAELLEDMHTASSNGHARDAKLDELTKRETEILRLVSEGLTNAQLARMLWLSEQTIKFHLSNIYRKLGVANRTEAGRWAQRHGALEEEGADTASLLARSDR